jgi:hypothetical protein
MTIQMSTALRDARLQAIENTLGTLPRLVFRSGPPPANCAAADTGTALVTFTLGSDWLAVASAVGTLAGLPLEAPGIANGTAGHYRFYRSAGAPCDMQGTAAMLPGSGDAMLDNTNIAVGQVVQLVSWSMTEGGA